MMTLKPSPKPSSTVPEALDGDTAAKLDKLRCRLAVLSAISGDKTAYEELFRRFHLPLLYFVRRIVKDQESADDVMQEVWMAVFKSLSQLRDPDLFSAWVYGIARNLARQHLRKLSRIPFHEALPEDLRELPAIQEDPSIEMVNQLHEALDQLKPIHREVLALKYMEELSYEQIAEVISGNVGTVRSRLHNAKRAILGFFKGSKARRD